MFKLLITASGVTTDYTRYLDQGSIAIPGHAINTPAQMTFDLLPIDVNFARPVRMAYVSFYSTQAARSLYSGFVSAEPVRAYQGQSSSRPASAYGQLYKYSYVCTSDEYLLNIKAVPFIPAFVNRTHGQILKALATTLCPDFFDTSLIADGDLVPYFEYTPTQSWSQIAKQFGDSSRHRYAARDKKLWYQPYDDAALGIAYDDTLGQGTFDPMALKAIPQSVPYVNDLTVIGDVEAGNSREDYFIGDGFTGNFPLRHKVFKGASTVLVHEPWTNTSLNVQQWFASDPGNDFDYTAGALNVTTTGGLFSSGDSYMALNNGIELAGGTDIQVGEVIFSDYCDGILGGLYTDTSYEDSAFLGGFLLSSTGGVTTSASGAAGVCIQPQWGIGATGAVGPAVVTEVNHSYSLQVLVHAPQYTRWQTVYRTLNGLEFGGRANTTVGSVTFIVQDYDIAAATGVFYTPKVTQASVNDVDLPPFAVLALVNNHRLNVSVTNTTIASMPLGGLLALEGPSGLVYPTGLILPMLPPDSGGFIGEAADLTGAASGNVLLTPGLLDTSVEHVLELGAGFDLQIAQVTAGQSADTLGFYVQSLAAAGTRIRFQSFESRAAVSRLQVTGGVGSIASQAALVGDDGIRSAIVTDLSPLPRTSEDCDNAAQAFLADRMDVAYDGSYVATNVQPASFFTGDLSDSQYWPCPGRLFRVNAPRRGITDQLFLVTQVSVRVLDGRTELLEWTITFGADLQLEKTLKSFVDLAPVGVLTPMDKAAPPVPYFTHEIDNVLLADLTQTRLDMTAIGDTVTVEVLDDWDGLIEVRTQDTNWGRSQVGVVTLLALEVQALKHGYTGPFFFTVWEWNFFFEELTGVVGPDPMLLFPSDPTTTTYTPTLYLSALSANMLNRGVSAGDRALIGVFTGPTFTLLRTQVDQSWFMRPVTSAEGLLGEIVEVITSRRSRVLHMYWPLRPSVPLFVGQNGTQIQFNFNGDQRNIYGFELRAVITATTAGLPYTIGQTIVLVQKPVASYSDMTIDLLQTEFVSLSQADELLWDVFAYFFNTAWDYSAGFGVVLDKPSVGSASLGQKTITTTPYALSVDDDVLTFGVGASVVNLPALTGVIRHTIYLVNKSGGTLSLVPHGTDTISGASSYQLPDGGYYQLMPNA